MQDPFLFLQRGMTNAHHAILDFAATTTCAIPRARPASPASSRTTSPTGPTAAIRAYT